MINHTDIGSDTTLRPFITLSHHNSLRSKTHFGPKLLSIYLFQPLSLVWSHTMLPIKLKSNYHISRELNLIQDSDSVCMYHDAAQHTSNFYLTGGYLLK